MAAGYRGDFERRLLALIRHHLDWADKEHPHGYEIGDFVITWEHFEAPNPEDELDPWEGGPYPGWWPGRTTLGSSRSYYIDENLLEKALNHIRERLEEWLLEEPEESEESEESPGTD